MGIVTFLRRNWVKNHQAGRNEGQLLRISPLVARIWDQFYDLNRGQQVQLAEDRIAALTALRQLGERFTRSQAMKTILPVHGMKNVEYLDLLCEERLLIDAGEDSFQNCFPRYATIQNCSHCNSRCIYCPVSTDPKPRKFIREDVFQNAVIQIAAIKPKWVLLNIANEPLLHADFLHQARCLAEHGLKLKLFTNGILLTPSISRSLLEMGVIFDVVINIASLDPKEYRYFMGIGMSSSLLENVSAMVETGLPVVLCVNGISRQHDRAEDLRNVFGAINKSNLTVLENHTHGHAGTIDGDENSVQEPFLGTLAGCRFLMEHVEINVDGNVLLCCQDYFDRHIIGNISTQNLADILRGNAARHYRRQIFGEKSSGPDFICRRCYVIWRRQENEPLAVGKG